MAIRLNVRAKIRKNAAWKSLHNKARQRVIVNEIGKKLNVKHLDDWYCTQIEDAVRHGGSSLLVSQYNRSLAKCVTRLYPFHSWELRRFKHVNKMMWVEKPQLRQQVEAVAQRLNIKHLSDWYKIKRDSVYRDKGGRALLDKYGSIVLFLNAANANWNLLSVAPPRYWTDHRYDLQRLIQQFVSRSGKSRPMSWGQSLAAVDMPYYRTWFEKWLKQKPKQRLLLRCIKDIFPSMHIFGEHSIGTFNASRSTLTVDIYVPALSLAFEYQGEMHYRDGIYVHHSSSVNHVRDLLKKQQCHNLGICLIQIPYWWQGDQSSILATIDYHAPHLKVRVPPGAIPVLATDEPHNATSHNAVLMTGCNHELM